MYEKITKLDHALQLFDEMTQRQPLPSVVKFTQLLQAVFKMKQYSHRMITIPQKSASRVFFNIFKGASPSSFLFTKTPFEFASQRITAHLHSNSASNYGPKCDRPRSRFEKITKLDDALQMFDEMTQRQPLPSVVKFNHLLQSITKMKHYLHVIDLFKQMTTIHAPVNVYTTNIVIKCCCQMSCTSDGFAIVAYGLRHGVVPTVSTFNTFLNGLILQDRILEAEKLFKKLIKGNFCVPDVVMYNTMIKGLCKFGNNETAIALVKLMDERGCKPNVVTYNTIIDSLCKDQMVDDALKLFKDMIFHKGILPSVITYSSLIRGLCSIGRWDGVLKMLKEMEEDERTSPNVVTFNILVDAFCKEGMVENAMSVINIMIERGRDPNLVTFNSLIDGFCLRGEMEKAMEVFDLMRIRGLNPNVVTYNSLLNGYCKSLKIDEAMHLFHEITEKGMKPDVITYNTMLQGLFRVGRCKVAHKLFRDMQAQNQIPNALTYGIILEGLCNNQQIDEALSLFRLMGDSKLNSDIYVYTILIDGAYKCGKPDIARDLFGEVLKHDIRSYTVMINGLCREGLVGEAKDLFLQMNERGFPPDSTTYNVLLQGLLKNKQVDMIETLLREMDGRGFLLDASTFAMLLDHITPRSADATFLKLIGGGERDVDDDNDEIYINHKACGVAVRPVGNVDGIPFTSGKLIVKEIEKVRVYNIKIVAEMMMRTIQRCAPSSLLSIRTRFEFASQRNLAHLHSNSASNYGPQFDRPPCRFEKITKLDDALQLFDQMTQTQPLPSVVKFNHLLQALSKMKHYSCVIDLFKQMTTIHAPVDVYTTNIVIKCCCQLSCTSQGFAIVAYGLRRGIVPNVHTFSTLLNGLILEDRILVAEKLFKKLIKGKFCVPDVVMYNTID
ncbi:hypothetical protein OSB04_011319 [Centaurea solstitialis]|uniref:Pentatricopeptide repeat-containing protein n=1 Tax=Centaurea solstitialis TaxID=347529 RepID=A0AA38TKX7_9ASTR|nr:hypothetical protein OSB04_011319 [Centaurea solstitialis]